MKFKHAMEVRDCLCTDSFMSRKQLMKAVKAEVSEKMDQMKATFTQLTSATPNEENHA